MSQDINRPGLNGILTRTLGMKAGRAPAGLLTPELQPSIVLENDRPEYHAVGGSQLMSAFAAFDQTLTNNELLATLEPPPGLLLVLEYAHVTITFSSADKNACVKAWVNNLGSNPVTQNSMGQGFCDARLGGSHFAVEANLFPSNLGGNPGIIVDHENLNSTGGLSKNAILLRGNPIIIRGAVPGAAGTPDTIRQQCGIMVEMADADMGEIEVTLNFRVRPAEIEELVRVR